MKCLSNNGINCLNCKAYTAFTEEEIENGEHRGEDGEDYDGICDKYWEKYFMENGHQFGVSRHVTEDYNCMSFRPIEEDIPIKQKKYIPIWFQAIKQSFPFWQIWVPSYFRDLIKIYKTQLQLVKRERNK